MPPLSLPLSQDNHLTQTTRIPKPRQVGLSCLQGTDDSTQATPTYSSVPSFTPNSRRLITNQETQATLFQPSDTVLPPLPPPSQCGRQQETHLSVSGHSLKRAQGKLWAYLRMSVHSSWGSFLECVASTCLPTSSKITGLDSRFIMSMDISCVLARSSST